MTFTVKKKADKPCPRCYSPMVEQADKTYACAKHGTPGPDEPRNGRALLDAMDGGEPVAPVNGRAHENSAGDEPGGSGSGTPALETSGDAGTSPAPAEPKTPTTRASRYGATPEERRARVISDIQALAKQLGRTPTNRDDKRLTGRAQTLLGTWAAAVEAAGLPRPQHGGFRPKAADPPPEPCAMPDTPSLHDLERAALDAELTYHLVRAHYLRERIRQHGSDA